MRGLGKGHTPVISALGKERPESQEFKANLGYRVHTHTHTHDRGWEIPSQKNHVYMTGGYNFCQVLRLLTQL